MSLRNPVTCLILFILNVYFACLMLPAAIYFYCFYQYYRNGAFCSSRVWYILNLKASMQLFLYPCKFFLCFVVYAEIFVEDMNFFYNHLLDFSRIPYFMPESCDKLCFPQVADNLLHDVTSNLETLIFCSQTLRSKVCWTQSTLLLLYLLY